jgi:hypothetical protein
MFSPSSAITLLAEAQSKGFPRFLTSVHASNPVNATPYIVPLWRLREADFMSNRRAFLDRLILVLDQLASRDVMPVAVLVGGSVLTAKPDPGDLDAIVFYRLEGNGVQAIATFGEAGAQWRRAGLDLRLIPADGSPLLLIKTVSFFTTLFGCRRDGSPEPGGLLLVDCADDVPGA